MEYTGFVRTVRRRALLIAVAALVGLALSAIAAAIITPTYQAKAVLFLEVKSSSSLYERSQFALQRIQSYPQLLDSPTLERSVINELDLDMTPQQLAARLDGENPANTVLLNVTATASSAAQAAAIANSAAAGLSREVNALENETTLAKNAVQLVPQIEAQPPRSPFSPQHSRRARFGAARRPDRRNDPRDPARVAAASDADRRGRPPRDRPPARRPAAQGEADDAEVGRAQIAGSSAAANLRALGRGEVPPVLLLAPVGRVARQPLLRYLLAWGLADTGRRVVVVETDAATPPPVAVKIPEAAPGLSELLAKRVDASAVVLRDAAPGVSVVPVGDVRTAPKQFDVERRFADAVRPIIAGHDVTVMQTGSVGVPVPLPLAGSVAHGALLVVSRRFTGEREAHRAVVKLLALGIVPMGVVMTDAWGPSGEDLAETWREDDLITIAAPDSPDAVLRPLSLLPVAPPAGNGPDGTREEG